MQCTAPHAPPSTSPLSLSPRRLAAACGPVPDPRRPASTTDALPAILTWAVAAILAHPQHLSVLALAEWGARQAPDVLRTRGFPAGRTPCQSTLQRLFRPRDGHALSLALASPLCSCGPSCARAGEGDCAGCGQ